MSRARLVPGARAESRPESPLPAPRALPPGPAAVLDLQRTAGNAAVARLLAAPTLQRKPIGWEPGKAGPYDDDKLKQQVTVEEELAGAGNAKDWLVLKAADDKRWLYIPPGALSENEVYIPYAGRKTYEAQVRRLKAKATGATGPERPKEERLKESEALEKAEDVAVRKELAMGTWGAKLRSMRERFSAATPEALLMYDDLIQGMDWLDVVLRPPHDDIPVRVDRTFLRIADALAVEGQLEETPDLRKKLNQVVDPVRPTARKNPQDLEVNELDEVSQALAELDYAAIVLASRRLQDPFVLGAQSRRKAPGQVTPVEPEAKHGGLPPLHVMNLEVDGYYRTNDGVLHADEVKNTPRALGAKLKSGGQLQRQLEWLDLPVANPDGSRIVKRVGYFVQATGPKFDTFLSQDMVEGFKELDRRQPGEAFLLIGSDRFTYAELKAMYDGAINWLRDSAAALAADPETTRGSGKYDNSKVFAKYFDSLETTRRTLRGGALKTSTAAVDTKLTEVIL